MHNAKELRDDAWTLLKASSETEEPGRKRRLIDEAFELAQRAKAMAREEVSSAPEAARLSYRLYLIDGGHFAAAHHFDIASDEAALAVADAVYEACSESFQGFELWQGPRLIAGNAQIGEPSRAGGAAGISARAQDCVLEIEESLLFSRRALAESRKLLASTEKLRTQVRRERKIA
jgi:hypothetical protein